MAKKSEKKSAFGSETYAAMGMKTSGGGKTKPKKAKGKKK
jgi:hypothetical protein